jgi:2-phosphosulfolactate phosphatase
MNIEILEFVDGARKAKGVTVIIDVFRAFSVACYAFDAGASRIIATSEVSEAIRLKSAYINSVLVGERDEKKVEGFDFGNSPTEILRADLTGKTVIHTTTAGTQGLINATGADVLLAGSLVNAAATARYINFINPENVSLVAMGYRATMSADEDLLCAGLISEIIKGSDNDFEKKAAELRYTSGSRFFVPDNLEFSPPTDFFLCTMINRFNFALKALKRTDGNVDLMRVEC